MAQNKLPQESSQALVITGDHETWSVARDIFRDEGYEAIQCAEPEQVLETVGNEAPAVIFIDSAVSPADTLTLCKAVRRLPGCDYVPMILLSAEKSPEALKRAYDADVTTVLDAPLDSAALQKHINSLGDTGRTLSGIRALRTPESDVLRSMPDAFFIAGKDGLLRQYLGGANDDAVLAPEEIEGRNVKDIWSAQVARSIIQNITRVLRHRDGHTFQFELENGDLQASYEMRLLVQGRDKVLMIIRNVSDGAVEIGAGTELRVSDTVTGLTARDVFMAHFTAMIAEASLRERGIAVFCIDIDRFTRINETLGRAIGDAVLKVTAKRIERCLRSSDQLARIDDSANSSLTRISGDEFVLILADIESREDVRTVAGRVQDAFKEPVTIEGHTLKVSPSIGISLYPLDGDRADELLKNARVALDEAKVLSAEGREFYSNTMKFRALKRFDVKNELRWAIEKGQLELRFLPRIDLASGHVAGLEALLRWMHPLRGSVPLSEVIPLAEATGLIFPIGEWVLNSACAQAAAWRSAHGDMPPVSINLSQQEFASDDLPALVRKAVEDSGLPPDLLELELTEGMLMRNRQANAILKELSGLGVGIVLDDFGQGHSSIAHLSSLPIKAIKIDRDFIDGVLEPGEKQLICSAMIAMSRELGICVIAEGVESQLQLEFLREKGCDAVQGFLYTEPLQASEVPGFLETCRQVADETKVIDLDTVRTKIAERTAKN